MDPGEPPGSDYMLPIDLADNPSRAPHTPSSRQGRMQYGTPIPIAPRHRYPSSQAPPLERYEQARPEQAQPTFVYGNLFIPSHYSNRHSLPLPPSPLASHPYQPSTAYRYPDHVYSHGMPVSYTPNNAPPAPSPSPFPPPPLQDHFEPNRFMQQLDQPTTIYQSPIIEPRIHHSSSSATNPSQPALHRSNSEHSFTLTPVDPYTHYPMHYTTPTSSVYPAPYGQYAIPVYPHPSPDGAGTSWWSTTPPEHVQPDPIHHGRVPTGHYEMHTPVAASPTPYDFGIPGSSNLRPPRSPHSTRSLTEPDPSKRQTRQDSGGKRSPPKTTQPRKAWHPSPPSNRSEWVMWVGNVPSDTTESELLAFFERTKAKDSNEYGSDAGSSGVLSAFIIPRSNCAFVNFSTQRLLERAVQRCNGQPLRPTNPRSMKLVCRIRKPDDDLRAGVGGQRGMGIHARWVREQRRRARSLGDGEAAERVRGGMPDSDASNRSIHSDVGSRRQVAAVDATSSPGSTASTSSSLLATHFPKRYFILKSLNESELVASVNTGTWSTQRHNEPVLDRAYGTSQEVYLIFSANKSGEFFGYARMVGPISTLASSRSPTQESATADGYPFPSPGAQTNVHPFVTSILSPPGRQVQESPGVLTKQDEQRLPRHTQYGTIDSSRGLSAFREGQERTGFPMHSAVPSQTAPAEMGRKHSKLSYDQEMTKQHTFDVQKRRTIGPASTDDVASLVDQPQSPRSVSQEAPYASWEPPSHQVIYNTPASDASDGANRSGKAPVKDKSLGSGFRVEWIRTERLSFQLTKHIRNSWNHDREVKVSRDGTELEPSTGAALIAEWEKRFPRGEVKKDL